MTDTECLVDAPSLPTLSPDRETLVLSKEVTEHSIVIKAFLDLLYDHELDRETFEDSRLYRLVIRFCRDWSCDLVIRKLEKSLHFSIATDFAQPISHFLIAIELLDPLLLDLSISHPVTEAWSGIPYTFGKGSSAIPRIETAFASGLGVPSMPILASARGRFDVRSWSWELYAQVPLTVVFALVQSIGPAKEYQASSSHRRDLPHQPCRQVGDSLHQNDHRTTSRAGILPQGTLRIRSFSNSYRTRSIRASC